MYFVIADHLACFFESLEKANDLVLEKELRSIWPRLRVSPAGQCRRKSWESYGSTRQNTKRQRKEEEDYHTQSLSDYGLSVTYDERLVIRVAIRTPPHSPPFPVFDRASAPFSLTSSLNSDSAGSALFLFSRTQPLLLAGVLESLVHPRIFEYGLPDLDSQRSMDHAMTDLL